MFGLTVRLTFLMGEMRSWDASFITPWSWFWKKLTCGYLSAVWLYCLVGVITEPHSNKQDKYIVILEWNEVFVNLLWVLTFVSEWKKVYLTFRGLTAFHPEQKPLQGVQETIMAV